MNDDCSCSLDVDPDADAAAAADAAPGDDCVSDDEWDGHLLLLGVERGCACAVGLDFPSWECDSEWVSFDLETG